MLVRLEQFELRLRQACQHLFLSGLVRQRFTGWHAFVAGFDPLLRLERLQQSQLGAQSGELLVQRGQIASGAVPLLLQKHDVVRRLESVQFLLLSLQLTLQLCHLGAQGCRGPVGSLLPRFFFEAQILLHQAVKKGPGRGGLCSDGPQLQSAAFGAFQNFDVERKPRRRIAAGGRAGCKQPLAKRLGLVEQF